jgi:transposase
MCEPALPTESIESLRAERDALREVVEQLRERIAQLEARLGKDSHNSSKPPSSDPPFKKPAPRSQRQVSGRKPGGQKGHPGATCDLVEDPDQRVVVPLAGQCVCGCPLALLSAEVQAERRQVLELVMQRAVTEYRVVAGTCICGCEHRSEFPAEVSAPLQYGPGVLAAAVYLNQYQLLPVRRCVGLLADWMGIGIAPATLARAVALAAGRLAAPVAAIGEALTEQVLAHADETGLRVGRDLHWLHVLSTGQLTHYHTHRKRGLAALAAGGLLARFTGTLVHDHWSAYRHYDCQHACCNAHHLRELTAISETIPSQTWAGAMHALLCEANAAARAAREAGHSHLPAQQIAQFTTRYDDILSGARLRNPIRPALPARRGRTKQSPAANLVTRLINHRDDTLRFLTDLRVPFDNNQAERDIRLAVTQAESLRLLSR